MGSAGSSVQASVPSTTLHQRRASAAAAAAAATGSAARNEVNIALLRGRDNLLARGSARGHNVAHITAPVSGEFRLLFVESLDNRREKRAV